MDSSGAGGHYFWHVVLNSTEVHSISTRQLWAEGGGGGGVRGGVWGGGAA